MTDYANLIPKQVASLHNQYIFLFSGAAVLCPKASLPLQHTPAPTDGFTPHLADGRTPTASTINILVEPVGCFVACQHRSNSNWNILHFIADCSAC